MPEKLNTAQRKSKLGSMDRLFQPERPQPPFNFRIIAPKALISQKAISRIGDDYWASAMSLLGPSQAKSLFALQVQLCCNGQDNLVRKTGNWVTLANSRSLRIQNFLILAWQQTSQSLPPKQPTALGGKSILLVQPKRKRKSFPSKLFLQYAIPFRSSGFLKKGYGIFEYRKYKIGSKNNDNYWILLPFDKNASSYEKT